MPEIINNIPEIYIMPPTARESFLPLGIPAGKSLRQQGITMAGISHVMPPYHISRPNPNFHLVLSTIRGSAQLTLPDRNLILGAGDLLVAPAHHAYAYQAIDDWHFVWFHLADIAHWRLLRYVDLFIQPNRDSAKMLWSMEGFIEENLRTQPDGNAATRSYADLILFYLERELAIQEDAAINRLHLLWAQVNRHLSYHWTVEELSVRVPCSPPQLFRDTAEHHAATPMEMVTRLRIARVKELLQNSEYTLEHIASLVGYATPFALSRVFKRHTGMSPREFRKEGGNI
ncbi:MAG: AraC family transcriptional regulator [bacterium]